MFMSVSKPRQKLIAFPFDALILAAHKYGSLIEFKFLMAAVADVQLQDYNKFNSMTSYRNKSDYGCEMNPCLYSFVTTPTCIESNR
jgi:hypothetical protein